MKRNIIKNKAKLSSSDIQKGKNFDELYNSFQKAGGANAAASAKPLYKKGWFTGGVATAIIAVTTAVILNMNKKETVKSPLISDLESKQTEVLDSTEQLFIKPPVPGVDVVKDRYVVKSGTGGEINHHTGTKITIPANAFVTEDGQPVTGDVNIEYREFHDQADIFFSGIPMEYDSAGSKSVFESAGMMEIRAYQNGKRLKVAPEKNFLVCMHSKNPDPKFNLYYLDEEKRQWDYKGKDSIDVKIPTTEPMIQIVDDSGEEFPESKKAVVEQEKVVAKIKQEIKVIEKKAPKKPTKVREDKYSFDLDVNAKEFPEIAQYNATVFEAVNQSTFDPKVYEVQWEDIELNKGKDGEYTVKLIKGKKEEKIKVKPVFEGKDYDKALKAFDKKFEVYKEELVQRKADEKKAEEELVARRAFYKKEQARIAEENKLRANKHNYISSVHNKINRIYSVDKFGTWNCDSPISRPKTKLLAFYTDKASGKEIRLLGGSLIEKSRNATFPMYNFDQITYNPRRENLLWGTDKYNNLVIVNSDQFPKRSTKNKIIEMKADVIDIKGKTLSEIKKEIGC